MTAQLPMTAGRRAALIVGTPLALLIIGWTALTAVAWVGEGSYPVNLSLPAHGRTVTVAVDSGDVRVSPGAGNRIRLIGTAHWALFRSRVRWQATPSGVVVRSQCRQPTGSCSFDYRVSVPRGLAPVISSGSGEITGASVSGPRVVIKNESGDITITGLASKDVTAEDQSGTITLTFAVVPDRVVVSGESGDIRLVLPPGSTAYRVRASTQSGLTTVTVPRNPSSPHVITVTDQSGNITVTH